jgi:HPt (histidine-containing phosphotransfer) domain-containing protein
MYLEQIRQHLRSAYRLSEEKTVVTLPKLLSTLSSHLTNLETTAAEGDIAVLSKSAHTMKGALLNLGLPELAEIAMKIEKHQELTPEMEVSNLVLELKGEVEAILRSGGIDNA